MNQKESISKKDLFIIFLSSFCLGIIVFLLIFGVHIINPFQDDWIFQLSCNWKTEDTLQHYFGWLYYRESPWQFPIGLISGMTAEDTSIIYTDSMPILAVISKLISPILPETYQYFGIATMLGFALNGAFGGCLLRKGIKSKYLCIVLSIIFIIAPSLSEMAFVATSLTGQWTILAALCLWFYSPYKNNWKNIVLWSALVFISMGLHLYIAAMVLAIFFVSIVADCIEEKKYVYSLIKFASVSLTVLFYLFVFGFFSGRYIEEEFTNGNQGDLLILFKPTDGEEYIGTMIFGANKMPLCGYLGIGIILGFVTLLIMFIIIRKSPFPLGKVKLIMCIILMVGCFAFSVTTNVYFNGQHIITLELPDIINKLYGMFRINGRFIWIVMYLIDYFVLVGLYRIITAKPAQIIALFMVLLLQIIDCVGSIKAAYQRVHNGMDYKTSVMEEEEKLIQEHDVIYIEDIWPGRQEYWDIIYASYRNKKELSSFYLARENEDVKEKEERLKNDLQNGIVHNEVLYVFEKQELEGKNYPLLLYDAGNGLYYGYGGK